MIEARGLVFRRGARTLLEGVDLRVDPGELVVIAGPNGAGKSTLLRLLSGELVPSAGEVRFDGKALGSYDLEALARRRAVLSQETRLAFPFTGREVVTLGRSPHRDARANATIVEAALARTTTTHLADRPITDVSGGEAQRVHLARVLAQIWEGPQPRALFLDEPTSSLDLRHQHGLLRHARAMAAEGCAVLCVLHDLNLAAQYADRIALLGDGRLVADGPPREVLTEAHLARLFAVDVTIIPHPTLGFPVVLAHGEANEEPP